MKKQKPINLNLKTIKFPVTAIASILHRVSGIILFLITGILLRILEVSLSSPEGFVKAVAIIDNFIVKFALLFIFTALIYHIFSGIRHMLLDFGYLKDTFMLGKISAYATFFLTIFLSILIGVLIW